MKNKAPVVLFNASVVLAGLRVPSGGSGKILSWAKKRKISGIISEIILDEVSRNSLKINRSRNWILNQSRMIFAQISSPPGLNNVSRYKNIVIDYGDAHVLASAKEIKVDFLVTLDKKHLLVLRNKIKDFKILTPGQLIELLSNKPCRWPAVYQRGVGQ